VAYQSFLLSFQIEALRIGYLGHDTSGGAPVADDANPAEVDTGSVVLVISILRATM
jgi:hypothetical protein